MYLNVYEGVHVCTPHIRQGTHTCTMMYTRGYMHVRMAGYICVFTLSAYGEVDPLCPTYIQPFTLCPK